MDDTFGLSDQSKSYLELHHGLFHALHVKDHLDQVLDGFGQFGIGAGGGCQHLHCLLILHSNHRMTSNTEKKHRQNTRKPEPGRAGPYLSVVDLQRVELVGIFGEVG